MRTSKLPLLAAAGAALISPAAGAALNRGPAATAAAVPAVRLAKTSVGQILVSNRNFTLYLFTRDKHGKNTCAAIPNCASAWPAYTTKSKPTAGPGVKQSLLRTITIANGRKQLTYAGHPLYRYAFDTGPRATSYVGVAQFGGTWEAVSAAGKGVR